jgi:hypothetical protein
MKAWEIADQLPTDHRIIIAAPTKGKAKALAHRKKQGAGYTSFYTEFYASRAPEFDNLAEKEERVAILGWEDGHFSFGCLARDLIVHG